MALSVKGGTIAKNGRRTPERIHDLISSRHIDDSDQSTPTSIVGGLYGQKDPVGRLWVAK